MEDDRAEGSARHPRFGNVENPSPTLLKESTNRFFFFSNEGDPRELRMCM